MNSEEGISATRRSRRMRIGPIGRLSLGLVALAITLVMLADLIFGILPSTQQTLRLQRQRMTETLASQLMPLLQAGDASRLSQSLAHVLVRDADLREITVRRMDGTVYVKRGAPSASGGATSGAAGEGEELRVSIVSGKQAWGDVTVRFASESALAPVVWLKQPIVQLLLMVSVLGFVLFYAYLRRAMHYLNPSASVPDRVRKTFDALAEGLVIVDRQGRIVLANQAFRQLHPAAAADLNGQRLDDQAWLLQDAKAAAMPWTLTLRSGDAVEGLPLAVAQPEGPPLQLLVSSAAVTDEAGGARGCLVTFDNITAVHQANEELRRTLADLESSRRRIEEQNDELRRLASRDALTGCLNRRAFFELAAEHFAQAQAGRSSMCFLMVDIDHFKQFNDSHGHGVGDQVIQVVARSLASGLRQTDLLGRYGGEEFCIALPDTAMADALVVAERMRADIESQAHLAMRGTQVGTITASFGLAAMNVQARSLEALIDQADQALYRSKQSGRNRVSRWQSAAALPETAVRDLAGEAPPTGNRVAVD